MSGTPRWILPVGFLAVAGGVAIVVTQFAPPPRPRGAVPAAPPATTAARPAEPGTPAPRAPRSVAPQATVRLEARAASGERIPTIWVLTDVRTERWTLEDAQAPFASGSTVPASLVGRYASAPGTAWAPIEPPGADGVAHVVLPRAGPAITLRVTEVSGVPAVGVPILYHPPGALRPSHQRTDAQGLYRIDDAAAGVLRVRVGGTERSGPTLRLVVGRDREASAVLDPPWVVTGVVRGGDGVLVTRTRVEGASPEGPCAVAVVGEDGRFRWTGRLSERLSLRSGSGAAEPALPDPRGPLESAVELRRDPPRPGLQGTLAAPPGLGLDRVTLRAEPAVLAVARDLFGPDDVLWEGEESSFASSFFEEVLFSGDLLPSDVPVRVTVRGDVLPEDHVLASDDPRWRALHLSPQPLPPAAAEPAAGTASPGTAPAGSAAVVGRVADVDGHGLAGVTVGGGGRRATTGPDGAFRLEGWKAGERVDVAYGWLDGADPGTANPADFAPGHHAPVEASAAPVTLVLPKAAGLAFRLLDGLDDRPLSWAHVVLADGEDRVLYDGTVATRDGRVTLSGLVPAAAARLFVFAPGYRRSGPVSLRAGTVTDAGDLRLSRGGRVTGTVRDRAGAPVAGATVALLDEGGLPQGAADAARLADVFLRRTRTDAKGTFVLDGLDASRPVPLGVWAPRFSASGHRVPWGKPEEAELNATLSRGNGFVLRLSDGRGGAVPGAAIDLQDPRGVRWLTLVHRAVLGGSIGSTDDVRRASAALLVEDPKEPGTYRIGPVEPGPYDLLVNQPGFKPLRARFNVPDVEGEGVTSGIRRFPEGMLDWPLELEPLPADGR